MGGDTHVGVAIAQDFVQDVAELPAQDGAAGQGQPDGVGPEGEGPLLVVRPQDDPFPAVKANRTHTHVRLQGDALRAQSSPRAQRTPAWSCAHRRAPVYFSWLRVHQGPLCFLATSI